MEAANKIMGETVAEKTMSLAMLSEYRNSSSSIGPVTKLVVSARPKRVALRNKNAGIDWRPCKALLPIQPQLPVSMIDKTP